jgi:hypothetical protein
MSTHTLPSHLHASESQHIVRERSFASADIVSKRYASFVHMNKGAKIAALV